MPKPEPTPYDKLIAAIGEHSPGAYRLSECAGPNKPPHPGASKIEFWLFPDPAPGRLVIIQRWIGQSCGGFDAYFQQMEHRTAPAIAGILGKHVPMLAHPFIGVGQCPVCGHHGTDCTGYHAPPRS